jgi:hypothetical protein
MGFLKQISAVILGIAGVSGAFSVYDGIDTKLGPAIDSGNVGGILAFLIISIIVIACLWGSWTLYNSKE